MMTTSRCRVGHRVLFVWSSIPLTGTVSSISNDSYGIICDSDVFTTDRLLIPRSGKEIFVKKGFCYKTGEISPIEFRNGIIDDGYRSADVKTAFYHLPKQTIFPILSGHKVKFINFIPEKFVFKFEGDKNFYLYTSISPGLVTLISTENDSIHKIPNWKFQSSTTNREKEENMVDEFDIELIYEIPERFIHQDIGTLSIVNDLNLVYNSHTKEQHDVRHVLYNNPEIIYGELPEYISFDQNNYMK